MKEDNEDEEEEEDDSQGLGPVAAAYAPSHPPKTGITLTWPWQKLEGSSFSPPPPSNPPPKLNRGQH